MRETEDSLPPALTSARTPAVVWSTSSRRERREDVPDRLQKVIDVGAGRRARSRGRRLKSVSVVPIQVSPARGMANSSRRRLRRTAPALVGQRRGTTKWTPLVVRIRPAGVRSTFAVRFQPRAGGIDDHARVDVAFIRARPC